MVTSCPCTPSPAVSPTLKQSSVSSIQQPCWHDLSPSKLRVDAALNSNRAVDKADQLDDRISALPLSRHALVHRTCPLSGVKQTCPFAGVRFRGRYWRQS